MINELDKRALPSQDKKSATAKSAARRAASVQPVLFKLQGRFFVKVDHTAIPVADASCFSEAAEFLFMCFYVFWVEYPFELRVFYSFLEQLMGLKVVLKSTTLAEFNRRLNRYLSDAPAPTV